MVYSLCMETKKTARLSSKPPSRLKEHIKRNMGVEGRIAK